MAEFIKKVRRVKREENKLIQIDNIICFMPFKLKKKFNRFKINMVLALIASLMLLKIT